MSDDSDIEVHPNVDKRSFIRAKQNQIHQQRYERRHQIETLKYEQIVNDGLLGRVDALLASLRGHQADSSSNPDVYVMQALVAATGEPSQDQPPKPPEGIHSKSEQPRYSEMLASLVDQVKKEFGEGQASNSLKSYVTGVEEHRTKILNLQKDLLQKLRELEKEEARKITSDSIHTGFNTSSVNKPKEKPTPKPQNEVVEVLNPGSLKKNSLIRHDSVQSSGADADVDEPIDEKKGDEDIEPTALGREFAKIKWGDYRACLNFISEHRDVVAERETDGLLIEAFNAQMDGKDNYAKQCVHQALLLQYCRSLGKDGVGLFFKRYISLDDIF